MRVWRKVYYCPKFRNEAAALENPAVPLKFGRPLCLLRGVLVTVFGFFFSEGGFRGFHGDIKKRECVSDIALRRIARFVSLTWLDDDLPREDLHTETREVRVFDFEVLELRSQYFLVHIKTEGKRCNSLQSSNDDTSRIVQLASPWFLERRSLFF